MAADEVAGRERAEHKKAERAEERLTLAHRNTGKWARKVLCRGAQMDAGEQRVLGLQVAQGDAVVCRKATEYEGTWEGTSRREASSRWPATY